jgi:hypothetical protein
MDKHPGSAENMKKGGADESSGKRQNSPFRQLHMSGHDLNHTYKNPMAKISMDLSENSSYMHPLSHGGAPKPDVPPQVWSKANSIKPMSQQGSAGKTGPPKLT